MDDQSERQVSNAVLQQVERLFRRKWSAPDCIRLYRQVHGWSTLAESSKRRWCAGCVSVRRSISSSFTVNLITVLFVLSLIFFLFLVFFYSASARVRSTFSFSYYYYSPVPPLFLLASAVVAACCCCCCCYYSNASTACNNVERRSSINLASLYYCLDCCLFHFL